jgi:hypothetical protein
VLDVAVRNKGAVGSCGSCFWNKSLRKSPDLQNDLFSMEDCSKELEATTAHNNRLTKSCVVQSKILS